MKIIRKVADFCALTGQMMFYDLACLEIEPDCRMGSFYRPRLEELRQFCQENPQFHIISYWESHYFNFALPTANWYYLGSKDADPELAYIRKATLEQYEANLISKLWTDKRRTKTDAVS